MNSKVSGEAITVMKSEFEALMREVVREVLYEELQSLHRGRMSAIPSEFDEGTTPSSTLGNIRTCEFFGMWRERDDLPDSPIYARTLRARAWDRSR